MENQDQEKKAVAIRENYINAAVWEQLKVIAQSIFASTAKPANIKNANDLMAVFQTGFEMGMKPMEALKSLYIVNGIVSVYGAAAVRRLREHGWTIEYKDEVGKCTATITKGKESYSETCTFDDAQKSGYTTANGSLKFGWKEGLNRKLKLRYGAISILLKTDVPEALGSAVEIVEVAEDSVPAMKVEEGQVVVDDNGAPVEPKTATEVPVTNQSLQDRLNKAKQPEKSEPTYDADALRKRFFAVSKDYGLSAEDAKELIKKKYKVASFKDLTPEQIIEATQKLESKLNQ